MRFIKMEIETDLFEEIKEHEREELPVSFDCDPGDEITLYHPTDKKESLRLEVTETGAESPDSGLRAVKFKMLEWNLLMEEPEDSLEKEYSEPGLIDYTGLVP